MNIPKNEGLKVKPIRILYLIILIMSLGLSATFYWQYRLKEKELSEHQRFNRIANKTLTEISAELVQSKKELEEYLQKIEQLNTTISTLESRNLKFDAEIRALKEEREELQKDDRFFYSTV